MTNEIKTKWDALVGIIDEEVEKGNGKLISEIDCRVYGIRVVGYPIAFIKTSKDGVKKIASGYLPPEVLQYSLDLEDKTRGLID